MRVPVLALVSAKPPLTTPERVRVLVCGSTVELAFMEMVLASVMVDPACKMPPFKLILALLILLGLAIFNVPAVMVVVPV